MKKKVYFKNYYYWNLVILCSSYFPKIEGNLKLPIDDCSKNLIYSNIQVSFRKHKSSKDQTNQYKMNK